MERNPERNPNVEMNKLIKLLQNRICLSRSTLSLGSGTRQILASRFSPPPCRKEKSMLFATPIPMGIKMG